MNPTGASVRFGTASSLALALAGCAQWPTGVMTDAQEALSQPEAPALQLPAAPRPVYRVGDTFVFGRTGVERVSRVTRDTLEWTGPEGQTFLTRTDFFTPLLQQNRWGREIRSRLSGNPQALWPLQVGRRVAFTEERTEPGLLPGSESTTTLRWTCEVQDIRLSVVPAGDFPSFHVVCRSRRDGLPVVLQTARWDYAPSLGHFVRHSWNEGGRRHELVLSAALPGALATPERLQRLAERLQAQP